MRNKLLNLFGILLALYTVFLICGMAFHSFSEISVPNEYQEVSNIQIARSFYEGINPYTLKNAVGGEEPGVVYPYGPVYPLLCAFAARFFSMDLIFAGYLVSFLAMLLSAVLGAWMVKEQTRTLFAPMAAFPLLINCTWRYGYVNAVPDALAFLWVMLALLIETRKKCRFRELLEVLFILLAFYTKIYMAYIALPLFLLKLLRKKKDALKFALLGLLLGAASIVVISAACPLLWTYSVYMLMGLHGITDEEYAAAVNRISSAAPGQLQEMIEVLTFRNEKDPTGGLGYEGLQLRSLGGIFIFFFLGAAAEVYGLLRKKSSKASDYQLLMLLILLVSVPVMAVLGSNGGAWLSYYLQIQIPALVMMVIPFLEEKALCVQGVMLQAAWTVFLCLSLVFTLYRTDRRLPYYYMTEDQKQVWADAYRLLDEYLEEGEIYYSPVLAFHAEKNGQYYYNNGFVGGSGSRRRYVEWTLVKWEQVLFPPAGEYMKKHISFQEELKEKIRAGDYAMITATWSRGGSDRVISVQDVEAGPYRLLKETDMPMSREDFVISYYIRTGGSNGKDQ